MTSRIVPVTWGLVRLAEGSYGRCLLTKSWGIDFRAQAQARFHFVAEGECWLRAPKRGWVPLRRGDGALVPRGAGHAAALLGAPPARYVAAWRMNVARGWLRAGRVSVAEAADRLGDDSKAAFSRAFKRFVGAPPSLVRREGREERQARDEHEGRAG